MITIQRAQNLDRISSDLALTQEPRDGWLKEQPENGLSSAVNMSHLLSAPPTPDRSGGFETHPGWPCSSVLAGCLFGGFVCADCEQAVQCDTSH